MAKAKDVKLLTVKRENPDLYDKVMNGEISLYKAYNEIQRLKLNLSEFRGTNSRKNEFAVDFKRIIQLHDPSPAELIEQIKKAYPFTWKEFLKD